MKLDTKTILMIIAGIVVLGGIYWYFFTGTATDVPLSADTTSSNPAQAQFETLVGELTPVSFDTSLLTDPRFAALVDIGTPVVPESSGRIDPFAPLPGIRTQ